ncbi:Peptidase C48 SUMO/Sentrin/Ubl1 [Penicillium cf. griseofulvum]|uniref:Peptidase C48 SUMO/Sentrin/Ubl1 n=1 Tax=Penicillium cf. griseofulvum TaxID=2972120 RepID=A0A9W9JQ84_9EURO|nr:Peptidase C48 SUMO/Sentrin/Ubl1 [Penicillium cf. griseofulvum]KAJ5423623.1 Peptidase C48 SUMO/Sentrin/Ubl1 [Penicillium cf. griseofulvum]
MGFFRWPRYKRRASPTRPTKPSPKISNPFKASKIDVYDGMVAPHWKLKSHLLNSNLSSDDSHLPIPGAFPLTPPESPTLVVSQGAAIEEEDIPPKGWEFMDIDARATPALVTDLGIHLHPRLPPYTPPLPSARRIPSPKPTEAPKPTEEDIMDMDDPWDQQAQQDARLPHGPVSAVQLFYAQRRPIPSNRIASWYEAEFERRERERLARERDLRRPTRVMPTGQPVRLISPEWLAKLQRALQSGQGQAVAKSLAGDDLYQRDIVTCIRSEAWLNDEIINAYLGLLVHYLRQSHGNLGPKERPRFHAFNTFFYSTLRDKGYDGVRRWANRAKIGGVGLLNVDTVFIPVHESSHWTLLVIRPEERTIEYFDSLGSRGPRQVKNVKQWLRGELGAKYKDEEWTVLPSVSSQQDNGSDCGVFLLTNAKAITVGVEPTAIGPRHIALLRRKIVAELMNGGLHGEFNPQDRSTGAVLL